MTFAELFLVLVVAAVLFRLLQPVQRRLERYLRRTFFSTRPPPPDRIIDITRYDRKDRDHDPD